ncbi:MAG: hypothetical protein LBO00_07175 [Zoogloeaceae bacterium]|nr:hypothetical protein [Zoogloeaceae bacterium]
MQNIGESLRDGIHEQARGREEVAADRIAEDLRTGRRTLEQSLAYENLPKIMRDNVLGILRERGLLEEAPAPSAEYAEDPNLSPLRELETSS